MIFWQDACSLDLVKFCRNVPARDGKRLQCLFYILRDEERIGEGDSKRNSKNINDNQSGIDTLGKECVKVLKQRSEMFKYVWYVNHMIIITAKNISNRIILVRVIISLHILGCQ